MNKTYTLAYNFIYILICIFRHVNYIKYCVDLIYLTDFVKITCYYNDNVHHSEPISLTLVDNAILKVC